MPTLTILKAGQHTDSSGQEIALDTAQLTEIAGSYQPEQHEAPLVIGHPHHNAPAYGWVRSLQVQGECLEAELGQVHEDAIGLVREGAFKKISASFYPAESPLNPTPGQMSLRHVGLLGAEPPAIKGLPAINFAETQSTTIEWSAPESTLSRLMQWIKEKFGAEVATEAKEYLDHPPKTDTETRDLSEAICFSEIAPACDAPDGDASVADLIAQAQKHVAEAQASGRTLGFAEAVTLAQNNR